MLGGGTAQSTITLTLWIWTATTRPIPWPMTRNDTFTLVDIPEKEEVSSASWGILSLPWWQEEVGVG